MQQTHQLLGIDRGVPEVFNSTYDLRFLLKATARLRDGETVELPGPKFVGNRIIKRLDHTQIGQLLTDFGLVPELADTIQRKREDDALA
ncbi:hypothetical protein [Microbacterium sp. gxy059]|uniref:hypothetical protein n=1 Tax=Microbacterium sp. gxy059 TaxID=2957199 RepID=UPI003D995A52